MAFSDIVWLVMPRPLIPLSIPFLLFLGAVRYLFVHDSLGVGGSM
jgi:hypothetical protein